MLSIRWDTLIVVAIVALMVACLVVQAVLRINGARLFEALRLSRAESRDEPTLYVIPAGESTLVGDWPCIGRPPASAHARRDTRVNRPRRSGWGKPARTRTAPVRRNVS
jgi:hypothetical protein